MTKHVAVIDIGKTNAKVVLVETDSFAEIAVRTRPNAVLSGPPYPHYDIDGLWTFILDALVALNRMHEIDAIVVTTHGACCALVDEAGALAMPVLDYEHDAPDALAADYDSIRPPFAETGSPRLPGGLNLAAQIYWLQRLFPEGFARVASILTYPQFWAFRLSGIAATEVTSLGSHTDLWCPDSADYSMLVERLGWRPLFPPMRHASERLGAIRSELAAQTGLRPDVNVHCGIHDSNASLLPHLLLREPPFSVVSTGTWVIAMAIGGTAYSLDPARDTLINIDAFGQPVRSARFMGGREHAILTKGARVAVTDADVLAVLAHQSLLLPSVQAGSGPFPSLKAEWRGKRDLSPGERHASISFYLGLMTSICLDLIGAGGPIIIEGPFAQDGNYLRMLAAATQRTVIPNIIGGTSSHLGAALLAAPISASPFDATVTAIETDTPAWQTYARSWHAAGAERQL
jgi:sugar (pentulose or hexulose) kinase